MGPAARLLSDWTVFPMEASQTAVAKHHLHGTISRHPRDARVRLLYAGASVFGWHPDPVALLSRLFKVLWMRRLSIGQFPSNRRAIDSPQPERDGLHTLRWGRGAGVEWNEMESSIGMGRALSGMGGKEEAATC